MDTIRIQTELNSDTLYLPQLKPFVGKSVEIIVKEVPKQAKLPRDKNWKSPLAGTVLEYRDPFEPASIPEEWESTT